MQDLKYPKLGQKFPLIMLLNKPTLAKTNSLSFVGGKRLFVNNLKKFYVRLWAYFDFLTVVKLKAVTVFK